MAYDGEAATRSDAGLRRRVGPVMLALYGAGTILGAGIYVLVGEIAGEAGFWTPVAFVVAAVIAGVNGMTYAELSTRVPSSGGPSAYLQRAFHQPWLSAGIGWAIVATGIVSAATIARGFSGYLSEFADVPEWAARAGLILFLGTLAASGVKQSAWFMAITTTCGVAGIAVVAWAGFASRSADPSRTFELAAGLGEAGVLTGVVAAVFLSIYAYIGFEDMVHLVEEVKRPGFAMPFAIASAIGGCAILYALVAVAALSVLAPSELEAAPAPLVRVVEATGIPTWPVTALSLVVISSGVLAQLIMASRTIVFLGRGGTDGTGRAKAAPTLLSQVDRRTGTPIVATAASAGVALALALFIPLDALASVTSLIMLGIFAASNVALIVLERRRAHASFDTPFWLPYLGTVLSVALIVAWATLGVGA